MQEQIRLMWCEDCKRIVEATYTVESETGYRDAYCPVSRWHDTIEPKECKGCGELTNGDFCHSCESEIKDWWAKRPTVSDDYYLLEYVDNL